MRIRGKYNNYEVKQGSLTKTVTDLDKENASKAAATHIKKKMKELEKIQEYRDKKLKLEMERLLEEQK